MPRPLGPNDNPAVNAWNLPPISEKDASDDAREKRVLQALNYLRENDAIEGKLEGDVDSPENRRRIQEMLDNNSPPFNGPGWRQWLQEHDFLVG